MTYYKALPEWIGTHQVVSARENFERIVEDANWGRGEVGPLDGGRVVTTYISRKNNDYRVEIVWNADGASALIVQTARPGAAFRCDWSSLVGPLALVKAREYIETH